MTPFVCVAALLAASLPVRADVTAKAKPHVTVQAQANNAQDSILLGTLDGLQFFYTMQHDSGAYGGPDSIHFEEALMLSQYMKPTDLTASLAGEFLADAQKGKRTIRITPGLLTELIKQAKRDTTAQAEAIAQAKAQAKNDSLQRVQRDATAKAQRNAKPFVSLHDLASVPANSPLHPLADALYGLRFANSMEAYEISQTVLDAPDTTKIPMTLGFVKQLVDGAHDDGVNDGGWRVVKALGLLGAFIFGCYCWLNRKNIIEKGKKEDGSS